MVCLFYRLPPEVRGQIFRPLCIDWNGEIPNLIKALRPDGKLYHEALEIFVKNNVYVLHYGNRWTFGDMTKSAVLRLIKIKIDVDAEAILKIGLFSVDALTTHDGSLWPESTALLSDATNIREVTLRITNWTNNEPLYVSHGLVRYHFNYFLKPFKVLDRVEVHLPWNFSSPIPIHEDWDLTPAISGANTHLKTTAKLVSVLAIHDDEESHWWDESTIPGLIGPHEFLWERWFWQAEEGQHLRAVSSSSTPTKSMARPENPRMKLALQ